AAVDVDQPLDFGPAPWVSEDSAYGYILGLLNSAQSDLTAAGSSDFPFSIPGGLSNFATPATFIQFNRALVAKANVLRATVTGGCGGTPANCYTAALTALGASFLDPDPATYQSGAYSDFSSGPGDATNGLSDPVT